MKRNINYYNLKELIECQYSKHEVERWRITKKVGKKTICDLCGIYKLPD